MDADRRDQQLDESPTPAPAEDKTTCPLPLAVLPDDVLADVLRRLPPRDLAASRCVCKAWLDVVDARRLLRADLLPLTLGGFFIDFNNYYISEFFAPLPSRTAPPPSSPAGTITYLPESGLESWGHVGDHCNGLVLVHCYEDDGSTSLYALSPATRWRALLPPCPPQPVDMDTFEYEYLAYDPAVSPDFQVVSVSRFSYERVYPSRSEMEGYFSEQEIDAYLSSRVTPVPKEIEQSEWPPSVYTLHVFSSRAGRWEARSFAREGDALGTVSAMRHSPGNRRNAVYWRGALYIHCQQDFVMRLSLSSDKYHVIKPPLGVKVQHYPQIYLGKSCEGVYCASIKGRCRLQVWNLDESAGCSQMEWVVKHDRDLSKWLLEHKLKHVAPCAQYGRKIQGPWALQDINDYYFGDHQYSRDHGMEASSEDEEFPSSVDGEYNGYMDILGFHPYEEIIYLGESITRGLAYHLSTSKVEVVGNIYPAGYERELGNEQLLLSSFPYTPCWLTQTTDENS